jgi:hypothetical protein
MMELAVSLDFQPFVWFLFEYELILLFQFRTANFS